MTSTTQSLSPLFQSWGRNFDVPDASRSATSSETLAHSTNPPEFVPIAKSALVK